MPIKDYTQSELTNFRLAHERNEYIEVDYYEVLRQLAKARLNKNTSNEVKYWVVTPIGEYHHTNPYYCIETAKQLAKEISGSVDDDNNEELFNFTY